MLEYQSPGVMNNGANIKPTVLQGEKSLRINLNEYLRRPSHFPSYIYPITILAAMLVKAELMC